MRNSESLKLAIVLGLLVIPLFFVSLYSYQHAPRIPFADQMLGSLRIAIKSYDGDLQFQDLWKQHNEHRIFFTRLVTATLARTSHWNLRLEASLSVALGVANLVFFAFLLLRPRNRLSLFLLVPIAYLVLPLRLWGIWQNSFLNQHLFVVFFMLLALLSLQKMPRGLAVLAVTAFWCFCATISVGTGLLSWLAIGSILVLRRNRQTGEILVWAALTCLSITIYFHNFILKGHDPTDGSLGEKLVYALTFLGNPFVESGSQWIPVATFWGLFALVTWSLCWYRILQLKPQRWNSLIWIAPGVFAIGAALLATISRSYIGSHQALISRYVAYSSLLWISLIFAVAQLLQVEPKTASRRWLRFSVLVISVVLSLFYIHSSYSSWREPSFVSQDLENCFLQYPDTGDFSCLIGLHEIYNPQSEDASRRKNLLRRVRQLKKRRLTIFFDTETVTPPSMPLSTPTVPKPTQGSPTMEIVSVLRESSTCIR